MINIAVRRFETDLRVLVFLDEKVFYQIVGWVYISFLLFLFSKRVRPCFIEDSAANVRNAMHIPYAHFFLGGGGLVIIAFYWIKPFSTAISALMTEEVAAPNLTLSIKQTNLTSKTGHSLILPTLTQAPL